VIHAGFWGVGGATDAAPASKASIATMATFPMGMRSRAYALAAGEWDVGFVIAAHLLLTQLR